MWFSFLPLKLLTFSLYQSMVRCIVGIWQYRKQTDKRVIEEDLFTKSTPTWWTSMCWNNNPTYFSGTTWSVKVHKVHGGTAKKVTAVSGLTLSLLNRLRSNYCKMDSLTNFLFFFLRSLRKVEFFTLSLISVETAQFTSFTWCVKLFAQLELILGLCLDVFAFLYFLPVT